MATKSKLPYPLVLIEWEDAAAPHSGWIVADEYEIEHPIATSVGFVLKENKTALLLAAHLDGNETSVGFQGGMIIPKSAIRNKKNL